MSMSMQRQGAAVHDHDPPGRVPPVDPSVSVGTHDLTLAHDEPVDDRAGHRDAPAHAEAGRSTETLEVALRRRRPRRPQTATCSATARQDQPRPRGRAASSGSAAAAAHADERVERHHCRGRRARRSARRSGLRSASSSCCSGPRSRACAVRGRLGGRARPSRRRFHAGHVIASTEGGETVTTAVEGDTTSEGPREIVERIAAGIGVDVAIAAGNATES